MSSNHLTMNLKAKPSRKFLLLAAACLALSFLVFLLFDSRLQPPSIVVKSVRRVSSGQKALGEALLCLTNGGRHEIVFRSGVNEGPSFITLMWFGVEKKQDGQWLLESQSRQSGYIWDAHVFKPGKAIDFRAQLPADGQPRRLVLRWRPTPGNLNLLFNRIKQRWKKLASMKPAQPEKYYELRSAELVVERSPDSDGPSFNSIAAREYKPWALSDSTNSPQPPSDFLRSR